jgi:prepilin-type processing-associated H-X9-DG protein
MLSFMEQAQIFNAINFYNQATDPSNATALNTKLNGFMCPSDGNAPGSIPNINSYRGSYGTTSGTGAAGSGNYPVITTGLFANSACYGIRDALDGSSNTIAFGEGLVGDPQNVPTKRSNAVMGAGATGYADVSSVGTVALMSGDLNTCTTSYRTGTLLNNVGEYWMIGSCGQSMMNIIVPPNAQQYAWSGCKNSSGGVAEGMNYSNAQSNHSGGCNFLFGDGSVKFVKSSVNMQIYWGLGTRANGEVIDAASY